ncbi:MAG: winged helix-turn-helix transcriptional regulator [Candidatus Didemnitutus sp.]|nr:winged helix-turn-helix transcriptional regulator [Candidatus Didemnitutus sp.]
MKACPNGSTRAEQEQGLDRVVELLQIAIVRQRQSAPPAPPATDLPAARPWELVSDAHEQAILKYLEQFGACAPGELARILDIPARTVTRRLGRLTEVGLVVAQGRTKGARYRLRQDYGSS